MPRERAGALPVEPDLLIGRDELVARVIKHLRCGTRVVTLTGPAGVGKTTLALHTAWQMRRTPAYPNLVVRWVRMTSVPPGANAEHMDRVVWDALDASDFGNRPHWDAIVEELRTSERHTLLVLDNCEHIVVQASEFVADLHATVPGQVTVLATSRESLGCVGEYVEHVHPLPYPREQDSPEGHWPALEMFEARAEALGLGRRLLPAERAIAAELVRSVDGLPLAITIDATRLQYESLPEIRDSRVIDSSRPVRRRYRGLDEVGGRANRVLVPEGLRQSLNGSYERLSPVEQRALDRLGVFDGGFDLPTATEICSDAELEPDAVENAVKRLVDSSLVLADTSRDGHRYRLLQPVRMFALEKIDDNGEEAALRRRHLRYFRRLASQYAMTWFSTHETTILNDAREYLGNFEAAMAYGLAHRELAVHAAAIAIHLAQLRAWFYWGKLNEGGTWLLKSLDATVHLDTDHPVRIVASAMAAWIALCQGRVEEVRNLRDSCLEGQRRLHEHGTDHADSGPFAQALDLAVRFVDGAFRMLVPHTDGTYDLECIGILQRAAEDSAAIGDRGGWAMCTLFACLGAAFHIRNEPDRVLAMTGEYLAACEETGAYWAIVWARIARALALLWNGFPEQAETLVQEAIRMLRGTTEWWAGIWAKYAYFWARAALLTERRQAEHSHGSGRRSAHPLKVEALEVGRAWGAAESLRIWVNVLLEGLGPFLRAQRHAEAIVRRIAGPDIDRAVAAGRELDHGQAMLLGIPEEPENFALYWQMLPSDLKRIARLAAQGRSNKEIGAEVHLSPKTVEEKVPLVLRRLGIKSRKELVGLRSAISNDEDRLAKPTIGRVLGIPADGTAQGGCSSATRCANRDVGGTSTVSP